MEQTIPQIWVSTSELSHSLHISIAQLHRLRHRGSLKPGIHWRQNGTPGSKAPVVWDLQAVDRELRRMATRLDQRPLLTAEA
jgi:hypothetical protein